MTQQELQFLEQHKINFDSVKLGFSRNIDYPVLAEYERIYKQYLDRQFVLTYWCGSCVLDMLKRLMMHYENFISQNENPVQESVQVTVQEQKQTDEAPSRKRTKRKGNANL